MQWSKETKIFAVAFSAAAVTATAVGFSIGTEAGVLMLGAAVVFGGMVVIYLHDYNNKINRMTEEIDKVLHNAEHIYFTESDEGELSVLQSEIVKMTQRIREQNHALQREKEYLADSLADIAHQLRTPLTSLNMVLSFSESCQNTDERKALYREAETLLMRVDSLLTTLLKVSRLDADVIELNYEQLYVNTLIEDALLPLQISLEVRQIDVQKSIPQAAVLVADRLWLSEALQNILKNCMERAGENGYIEIYCEDTLLYTMITIHDSGSGFQKDDIPHLFERFYRGKYAAAAGFGIGLALAKKIIDRHGGMITADNHLSGGALFTIKFYK